MSTETLTRHLHQIEATQDKIMGVSRYMMMMTPEDCVQTWEAVFNSMCSTKSEEKLLPLLYVANDVMQKAKAKKQQQYILSFAEKMPTAFQRALSISPKLQQKLKRMTNVWQEREVVSKSMLQTINDALDNPSATAKLDGASRRSGSRKELVSLDKVPSATTRCAGASLNEMLADANFRYDVTRWCNEKYAEEVPEDLAGTLSKPIEEIESWEELNDFLKTLDEIEHVANNKKVCAVENSSLRQELLTTLNLKIEDCQREIQHTDEKLTECNDFLHCTAELSKLENGGYQLKSVASQVEGSAMNKRASSQSYNGAQSEELAVLGTSPEEEQLMEGRKTKRARLAKEQKKNSQTGNGPLFSFNPADPSQDEDMVWNPVIRDYQKRSTIPQDEEWRD
eukprot:gb/GECG01002056.1/.p1 GENE.gb/GECG01002056.1/~~gb/GECG01002056.1/.p1  ORF type:complete len:395 (+),score=73.87 gb/GECG01002056.1/:1-1185(+)